LKDKKDPKGGEWSMDSNESIAKDPWETKHRSITYGKFFWHIGLPGKSGAEILLWSNRAEIGSGGTLLMYDPEGCLNLALAPGEWKHVYTASVFDGHPVAVEHWSKQAKQLIPKEEIVMNKQPAQTENRYGFRDIGMDTLSKERIKRDSKGRIYLDYGNIVGNVSFRVRLYIDRGLPRALEEAANRGKPRRIRSSLNSRGEQNEQQQSEYFYSAV
jgi:hypothetical protein